MYVYIECTKYMYTVYTVFMMLPLLCPFPSSAPPLPLPLQLWS